MSADTAVILGQGNVALDVARILLSPIDLLEVLTVIICTLSDFHLSVQSNSQSFALVLHNTTLILISLQCGHSNHERYGFFFTLFVLYFHLFC